MASRCRDVLLSMRVDQARREPAPLSCASSQVSENVGVRATGLSQALTPPFSVLVAVYDVNETRHLRGLQEGLMAGRS